MPRPTHYPAIAAALKLLGPFAVTSTFAADVALLAGVTPADVAAHVRLGHILIHGGRVQSHRAAA